MKATFRRHGRIFLKSGSQEPDSRADTLRSERLADVQNGQMSVFDVYPLSPYPDTRVCSIESATQLSVRKWCHGEIRVSLSPRYGANRPLPAGWERGTPAARICVSQGQEQAKNGRAKGCKKTLVRRREFQDDIVDIAGYGSLPRRSVLTRYAARQLEECSEIAKRRCGKNGVFLTGTVAGSGALPAYVTACWSGYILSLLRQWIRDHVSDRFHVFGVWEHQQRGMLHLHICVMSNDVDGLAYLLHSFQPYWRQLFISLSNATKVDLFARDEKFSWRMDPTKPRCDAGWLLKDPAKYLGKYCGKEACRQQSAAAFCPSRWSTVDRATAKEAVSERISLVLGGVSVDTARVIFDNLQLLAEPTALGGFFYGNPVFAEDETLFLSFEPAAADWFWYAARATIHYLAS